MKNMIIKTILFFCLFFGMAIVLPIARIKMETRRKMAAEAAKKRAESQKTAFNEDTRNETARNKAARNETSLSEGCNDAEGKHIYDRSPEEYAGGTQGRPLPDGKGFYAPAKPAAAGTDGNTSSSGIKAPEKSGFENLCGAVEKLSPAARSIVLAEVIGTPAAMR